MDQRGRMAPFYDAIQRDLCLFVFILLTLCIYRAYFMFAMAGYIAPETSNADIGLALFTGLRLSLKTAGWIALPSFVFCSLPLLAAPRLTALLGRLRLFWGTLAAYSLFSSRRAFPFIDNSTVAFKCRWMQGWRKTLSPSCRCWCRSTGSSGGWGLRFF